MAVAKPLANYDIATVSPLKSFIVQVSGDCYRNTNMLSVIMLSVIMLSVVMPNGIKPSVMVPYKVLK